MVIGDKMKSRIKTTGFESCFIDSWVGWDEIDTASMIFYKPFWKEEINFPESDSVVIDLDNLYIEGYNENGDVLFNKKIKVVLDE